MFFGKQGNNGNSVNINTSFYTSYSDTAMVAVGGWNKQLSIKIHPCTGKDANGVNTYAQEQTQIVNTGITQENAIALYEGYEDNIVPAIKNRLAASVSISMGSTENKKVLTVKYDGKDAYLEVAVGVDSNGIAKPENVITHKFNKRSYMTDYNSNNGSGNEVAVESDLFNFMEKIKAVQALIPTVAHSITYSNAVKQQYSKNTASMANTNNSYSAPTNSFGGDMSEFLPIQ